MISVPVEIAYSTSYFLAPFLRYGDLLAENGIFFLPLSHSAPHSLCSLWNFAVKLTARKLEPLVYFVVKVA